MADEDDTFHAFLYDNDIPRLNEQYLQREGNDVRQKADNLFRLIKLDNFPLTPKDKDRRYSQRNEARRCAEVSKAGWGENKRDAGKGRISTSDRNAGKIKWFFLGLDVCFQG